ncbi:zinc finger MYM-type protein 1-like [Zingiber officinale]|uniref:zinc finger MYM-type protein 1-like n=1 Tax=Zingiber officinale TaxID=94328 RepID=UPI001C4ACEE1|nr:zinc finger MYM-type protein 1-like [Zingiber officinale]
MKQREEALIQSQAGDINKYFRRSSRIEREELVDNLVIEEQSHNENEELVEAANFIESNENLEEDSQHEKLDSTLNLQDPENWNNISQKLRDYLIEMGPKRVNDFLFPKDSNNRHFDSSHYTRVMTNGQTIDRRWLVYSISLDKIFCFCCKLFKTEQMMSRMGNLGNDGYKDWRNIHRSLKQHEASRDHMDCMIAWVESEKRLKKNQTIDYSMQLQINKERQHWRQVLTRIISIVKTLAKNTLAFRGDDEKLYVENNGLFLQMIEMVAEFDPVMEEHVRRCEARESQYTYFSPKIQNELIETLANEVKRVGLDIDDIRGQGYDNGSNMSGRHKGVQKRLLEINPRAFYTPCGCHSLNLALVDMVECCPKAKSFFGVVQRIYTLFSSSTKRWKIFKDKVPGLTVKPLSHTRWESHVESVKAIKEQIVHIRDALLDLAEVAEDSKTKSDAETLALYDLESFEFLLGIVIWYNLLRAINTVSKFIQSEDMDIDIAINLLQGLVQFLDEFRDEGFASSMNEAKQMASEMGIEPTFREKRIIRRKKQFDESDNDNVTRSGEESFRVEYFLFIIDQARSSLQVRFEQFKQYEEIFGFLLNLEKLKNEPLTSLMKSCMELQQFLSHDGRSDINGDELYSELTVVSNRCIGRKKFLEVEVNQELSSINNVTG